MVNNLTIVIPFYNGYETIDRLLCSIPVKLPIIIVDDLSTEHRLTQSAIDRMYPPTDGSNIRVIQLEKKGYFAGAVNRGIEECSTDVLVLNQDVWFDDSRWLDLINQYRAKYAFIGERIKGDHPAFGATGYIHGTFMFMRRDAIRSVGLLNGELYPLWGNTAEYQWRVARKGFKILPFKQIPGMNHERAATERFGSSIKNLLEEEPEKRSLLVSTPPLLSVIVPCYNYGHYIADCVSSLIGGPSSLGKMPGQTLQSFEVIIVDDASTDTSAEFIRNIVSEEKGVRAYYLEKNVGTAQALNYGIKRAVGKYITFLSADDMREADSLERMVKLCEQNPHSFVYDDIWLFHSHKRIKQWEMEEYNFDNLLQKNHVHAGIVYPKIAWEEAGGYPVQMNDGREDWAFNIALGVKGWCGIHDHHFGYLYRREGQNRTVRNTTPEHRERFLAKIMNIFPDLYRGNRPMACCGKSSGPKNSNTVKRTSLRSVSGGSNTMARTTTEQMVKIEYLGSQMSFTISGDSTNTTYTFGKDRPRGWVYKSDVGSKDSKTGFLSKKDRFTDKYLYRLAQTEEVVEESVPEPEIDENLSFYPASSFEPVVQEEGLSINQANLEPNLRTQTVSTNYPDPTDLNVEEIKRLELSKEQWESVYKAELAGRNRKGATSFIEEKLANWT